MVKTIGNVQEDGQVRAVASGALSNGDTVVVNSDGTVSAISQQSSSAGATQTFDTGSISRNAVVHDTVNNKIIIAYGESNSQGKAVVGTVNASAKTISFGTAVQFDSGHANHISIGFDPVAGACLIIYQDNNNSGYGTGIVGTVSGTSISFGTPRVFLSDNTIRTSIAYDTDAGKFLMAYANASNQYEGTSKVATISGTDVSYGTQVKFNSGNNTPYINAVYDPDQGQVGVFFKDNSTDYGTYVLGTISGTSVSFTSKQTFRQMSMGSVGATYDTTNNKFVVAYSLSGVSNRGFVNAGTSDGSSITFGTEAEINNPYESIIIENATVFDESAGKALVMWRNSNSSYDVTTIPVDASGSTPVFDSAYDLDIGRSGESSAAYDSTNSRVIYVANNNTNTANGEAKVWATTPTNLTSDNFIGFADGSYADTQSAAINSTCSVDDNQTGLTAGQKYYVQTDGTLSTTAGSPTVEAGTAISPTKILVKG